MKILKFIFGEKFFASWGEWFVKSIDSQSAHDRINRNNDRLKELVKMSNDELSELFDKADREEKKLLAKAFFINNPSMRKPR